MVVFGMAAPSMGRGQNKMPLGGELTSSGQCINGSAANAVALGAALINVSPSFVSSDLNRRSLAAAPVTISNDPQPQSQLKALATVRRLPVRGYATQAGFDGLSVTMIDGVNDPTNYKPFVIAPIPPSLAPNDPLNYERMILRAGGIYNTRFVAI
jgi:hypothetical protein